MKIGILTQPLLCNYGGLLQAYALQSILEHCGHDVSIINREPAYMSTRFPNNIMLDIKYYIRKLFGKTNAKKSSHYKILSKETGRFSHHYLKKTPSLYNAILLKKITMQAKYDAYVVGSDQVWRPAMSPNIFNYFIDFDNRDDVKRIAYAASFGVDTWEFSDVETQKCATLAKRFDAISVREASGVKLCKEFLGVDATHVLDPTLLLEKEDYIKLVKEAEEPKCEGNLFCYVLDKATDKTSVIHMIAEKQGMRDYYCMPELEDTPDNIEREPEKCVYPPVTKWLRSFMDAEMVLTDSFHGTVFSIIFNKPFWVIGNKKRGMSRFESILGLFGLQNRLITSERAGSIDWGSPIDWDDVNEKKQRLQVMSMEFLKNNINKYGTT